MLQILPALLIFVGAPLLIWWMRKGRAATSGSLRVISRTALTRNGVVAVVETDGRRFLVGATDHGIGLLSELDGPASAGASHDGDPAAGDVAPTTTIDIVMEDRTPARPAWMTRGPGTSPIDALREMTVRKPTRPRLDRVQTLSK